MLISTSARNTQLSFWMIPSATLEELHRATSPNHNTALCPCSSSICRANSCLIRHCTRKNPKRFCSRGGCPLHKKCFRFYFKDTSISTREQLDTSYWQEFIKCWDMMLAIGRCSFLWQCCHVLKTAVLACKSSMLFNAKVRVPHASM